MQQMAIRQSGDPGVALFRSGGRMSTGAGTQGTWGAETSKSFLWPNRQPCGSNPVKQHWEPGWSLSCGREHVCRGLWCAPDG